MRTGLALTALAVTLPLVALAQGRAASDSEILQAATAVERADTYTDLLAAIEQHAPAISSARTIELIDARLKDRSLDDNSRGLLLLERQLSLDVTRLGAAGAARLLGTRLIAGYALAANSPEQLSGVLDKFAPLAKVMTPQLVRDALNTPGNNWPPALLPLMEQLARDWPVSGALAAARRMAQAAAAGSSPAPSPAPPAAQPTAPARAQTLTGHWRNTRIVFEQPQDEHLVIHPDGTAETWMVTAGGQTPVTRGRWRSQGTTFSADWQDGRQWGQPFTFYQGQLVFPNIPNQRKFWDRLE
jgi:hypothetical protein